MTNNEGMAHTDMSVVLLGIMGSKKGPAQENQDKIVILIVRIHSMVYEMPILIAGVVLRFMDLKKCHAELANVLVGNFFVDECVSTVEKIAATMSIDIQLRCLGRYLRNKHGVGVVYFICGDLHFMRCGLRRPATGRCPFCECQASERLFKSIPLSHYIYDSDHMIADIISNFTACVWRQSPGDLQFQVEGYTYEEAGGLHMAMVCERGMEFEVV